MSGIETLIEHT